LAGRVEPAENARIDDAPSLYAEAADEGLLTETDDGSDPYAADPGYDPYRRFREPPDSVR
ncbi:MAG: hypothetical protein ABIP21_04095, partial [Acidimicrobiia bacterium]